MGFFQNTGTDIDHKQELYELALKLVNSPIVDDDFKFYQSQLGIKRDYKVIINKELAVEFLEGYSSDTVRFYYICDDTNSDYLRDNFRVLFDLNHRKHKSSDPNELEYWFDIKEWLGELFAISKIDDEMIGMLMSAVNSALPENVRNTKLYKKILKDRMKKKSKFLSILSKTSW